MFWSTFVPGKWFLIAYRIVFVPDMQIISCKSESGTKIGLEWKTCFMLSCCLLGPSNLHWAASCMPCRFHARSLPLKEKFKSDINGDTILGLPDVTAIPGWTSWWPAACFFPKDVSSQGSSEDCWRISHHTYLTPHISHTYPSHHTYPTHIHSKRIPPIRIPPIRIPPIRVRSTRIPPVRIHAMRIHSKRLHQQVCNTYPTNTYPCYTYPFNAYPFKRCASAGIANVSHQYISHQYVSSTRIPPVRIHSMRIHSKSLHQQEWQWVWVSLHIISYHCYSAGMVMNIETLLFLQFLCKIINWI